MIFSCRYRKHRVKLLNMKKKNTCHYLKNVFDSVILLCCDHLHGKPKNNNFKELSVFDTLELYSLITEFSNSCNSSSKHNLIIFVKQKIDEKLIFLFHYLTIFIINHF